MAEFVSKGKNKFVLHDEDGKFIVRCRIKGSLLLSSEEIALYPDFFEDESNFDLRIVKKEDDDEPLENFKADIEKDIRQKVANGDPIAGEILPKDIARIEVIGIHKDNLQVSIMYHEGERNYFYVKQLAEYDIRYYRSP